MLSPYDPLLLDPKMSKRAIPFTPTFARSSIAYENGVSVTANQPRFFDGEAGIYGLLCEINTTNLLSAAVSSCTSGWSGDGTVEYDTVKKKENEASVKWTPGSGAGWKQVNITNAVAVSPSTSYTASIYMDSNVSDTLQCCLYWYDSGLNYISSSCGTAQATQTGFTRRLTVTGTSPSNAAYCRIVVGRTGFDGDEVFWLDCAQLEQKSYVTSWHVGGATRTAESCSIPLGTIQKILNLEEGTLEWEMYVNDASKVLNVDWNSGWRMRGGSPEERFWFYHDKTASNWAVQISDGTNSTVVGISDTYTPNGWHRFAFRWKKGSSATLTIDGSYGTAPTTFNYPMNNHYNFYFNGYATYLNTHTRNFCFSSRYRDLYNIRDRAKTNPPFKIDKYVTAYFPLQGSLQGWLFR